MASNDAIPFTATLTFTPAQLTELIRESIRNKYGYECDVKFTCTHQYDQMDRGPGTPVLGSTICTVKNGILKPKQ